MSSSSGRATGFGTRNRNDDDRRIACRSAEPAKRGGVRAVAAPSVGFWLPAWALASRELVRFFRQRTRVVGALGQPFIFWVFFGAGLGGTFKPPAWAPPG